MRMKFVIYKIEKLIRTLQLKILLLFCTIVFSCSLNSADDLQMKNVIFKLPDCTFFYNENIEITRWKIEINSINEQQKYYVSSNTLWIAIKTPFNYPVSVTATPLIKSSLNGSDEIQFFQMSGGIYPYDFDESQNFVSLTWEAGFTAYLMQQLYKSNSPKKQINTFIQTFNWKNLEKKIFEKTTTSIKDGERFYNPWLCDIEKILSAISKKTFSTTLLNNSKCNTYIIDEKKIDISSRIFSSYIPENQFIREHNQITIKTTKTNFFMCNEQCLVLQVSSSKNVSTAIVNMPIYIEEL